VLTQHAKLSPGHRLSNCCFQLAVEKLFQTTQKAVSNTFWQCHIGWD